MLEDIRSKVANPKATVVDLNLASMLWTLYCDKFDLLVDTKQYDDLMLWLWDELTNKDLFCEYEDFYNFMCKDLV